MHLFLLGICILLYFENMVFINNVRISFLLSFATLMYLFVSKIKGEKINLLLFYTLVVLSVINRIEIAMVVFILGFIYSLIFSKKKILHSANAVIICAVFYSVFLWGNYTYNNTAYNYIKIEKALDDRRDFRFSSINNLNTLTNEEVKMYARALFVLDEPTLNIEEFDFSKVLKHKTFSEYIMKNSDFFSIYTNQLIESYKIFTEYYWPVLIILFISIIYISLSVKAQLLKIILFTLCYIAVIPFLALMGEVPKSFIAPYITTGVFISIWYIYLNIKMKKTVKVIFGMTFLICSLLLYITNIQPTLNKKRNLQLNSDKIYNDFKTEEEVFILTIFDWKILPVELFHPNASFIFNSISFRQYDHTNIFQLQKERTFGENYASLKHRFEYLIKNKRAVYGSNYITDFYKAYLNRVHDFKIEFIPIKNIENTDIYKFRIEMIQ
ncbi:MAG: hypothetical protein WD048_01770 [Chitinophagales bacterium]